MTYTAEAQDFINDLDRIAKVRIKFAGCLEKMAQTLGQAEAEGENTSGQLALAGDIENLDLVTKNLQMGSFRLLVLGDMKRGKSTFLNALIGEDLLPSDVAPCTALLTTIRSGEEKEVIVYFKGGKDPKHLNFDTFKQLYTVNPRETKRLQTEGTQAFPDVDYAVVQYPLPLLEKGVEIVDSPGLNDTEERNERVLGYIRNCHAILFVLSATQQFTLEERRYLDDYIRDRGLTTFFLINRWDEIAGGLLDRDNPVLLEAAEEKVRTVFKTNLAEYCKSDGKDLYAERVFEISSLSALRQRLRNLSLEKTGFPEFLGALDAFLMRERFIAELHRTKTIAREVYTHVHSAIERRLPLLDLNVDELRQSIAAVEPEFDQLSSIRNDFIAEIDEVSERQASTLATSFRSRFSSLDQTFETDFERYQPELRFLDFLRKQARLEFQTATRQAFNKYLNDQMAAWSLDAERQQEQAYLQLASRAAQYGTTYTRATDKITEVIASQVSLPTSTTIADDQSPSWLRWVAGGTSLLTGDFVGAGMATTGAFSWKNIMANIGMLIAANAVLYGTAHVLLTPVGGALVTAATAGYQAKKMRKKFFDATKEEMRKTLPSIADKQSWDVYQSVKDGFKLYKQEVINRMDADIKSRKAELNNLLAQKQSREINREEEVKRLTRLDGEIFAQWHSLEEVYDHMGQTRPPHRDLPPSDTVEIEG